MVNCTEHIVGIVVRLEYFKQHALQHCSSAYSAVSQKLLTLFYLYFNHLNVC